MATPLKTFPTSSPPGASIATPFANCRQLTDRELNDIGIRRGEIRRDRTRPFGRLRRLTGKPNPVRGARCASSGKSGPSRAAFLLARSRLTAPQRFVTERACALSMSSAAASPAPRPPGRSPRPASPVVLHEMRPLRETAAHRTDELAELVCSNSFRSDDAETNAVGVLHREMRALGSLILRCADAHQVPAGGALAVDRDGFSAAVEAAIRAHPLIESSAGEIAGAAAGGLGQRRSSRPAR